MAKRLAELGALQDAVTNDEAAPSRLGLAGYIRGLFLDWSANPYNPLSRLTARGRLLGYFWDSGAIGLSMNFADQNFLVKDGTVKSKSFSDIVNFSRTTNATVTNSAGLITYAPHNLLTYSEQFDNAAWSKSNLNAFGSGSTANNTTAPDGTITADKITPSATSAPSLTGTITNATPLSTYTSSVYVKAAGVGFAYLQMNGVTGTTVASFVSIDLSNGTLGTITALAGGGLTNASATSTSVANGFYRITLTGTIGAGNTTVTLSVGITDSQNTRTGTISTTNGIYIWGAQLEIGSTATTYNSTTVKNLLGYSELFDNAAWTKSNSFVQTNGITYSEALDNAAWTKSGTTITANDTIAPNGYQAADKVVETATTARHFVYPATYAVVTGNVYTVSFYAKAAERTLLQVSGSVYNGYANIDLSTGTQVAGTSSFVTITPDINGFYKIVYTFTSTATSTSVPFSVDIITNSAVGRGLSSYAGDGTSGIYVWGFQIVQGSVAGDYRRTDAAALPVYYPNHNGVVCAEKLVENTLANIHVIQVASAGTVGAIETFSVYAKAGERNWMVLQAPPFVCYFNLSTGTVGTTSGAGTSSIQAVGNGWYRCSITVTRTVAGIYLYVSSGDGVANYSGNGSSGIYIFGFQLSDSASLDPYVLNAAAAPTAAAYYGARFDYDPVTLAPKGLLIEEQRTNLVTYSDDFSNVAWIKDTATISSNAILAPDNTLSADKLIPDVTNDSTHRVRRAITNTAATHSITLFAKSAGYDWIQIRMATQWCNFNTSTGEFGFSSGASNLVAESFLNGWWKITCTLAVTASNQSIYITVSTTNDNNITVTSFAGDGTSGVYIWGYQAELGAFATSYIPTAASQVTRAADVATIQGSNFYSWYNQNEGSVVASADAYTATPATNSYFYGFSDGTTSNAITGYVNTTNNETRYLITYIGASQTIIPNAPIIDNTLFKHSSAYATNNSAAVLNNGTVTTDTDVNVPIISKIIFGSGDVANRFLNGHIKSISYYPQRLSNDVLKGLTA